MFGKSKKQQTPVDDMERFYYEQFLNSGKNNNQGFGQTQNPQFGYGQMGNQINNMQQGNFSNDMMQNQIPPSSKGFKLFGGSSRPNRNLQPPFNPQFGNNSNSMLPGYYSNESSNYMNQPNLFNNTPPVQSEITNMQPNHQPFQSNMMNQSPPYPPQMTNIQPNNQPFQSNMMNQTPPYSPQMTNMQPNSNFGYSQGLEFNYMNAIPDYAQINHGSDNNIQNTLHSPQPLIQTPNDGNGYYPMHNTDYNEPYFNPSSYFNSINSELDQNPWAITHGYSADSSNEYLLSNIDSNLYESRTNQLETQLSEHAKRIENMNNRLRNVESSLNLRPKQK